MDALEVVTETALVVVKVIVRGTVECLVLDTVTIVARFIAITIVKANVKIVVMVFVKGGVK